jgi:hypothetical protein
LKDSNVKGERIQEKRGNSKEVKIKIKKNMYSEVLTVVFRII